MRTQNDHAPAPPKGAPEYEGLAKLERVAKALGWGRNQFISCLKQDKILQCDRTPYLHLIDAGYFRIVERTPWVDDRGNRHRCWAVMVTSKGQIWLAERYKRKLST